ncbi:hypothetical protein HISP_16770 [Haloarcula hispanica N601]|uniref:Uncharacterized protein n=2 Tax=Haloarcula hispanica TaxID=51589 RepID=V5TSX4_HALHI|nr:hypothetical protein HAH_4310 [Haloarcula hispanica ATCC 33960]AHB67679.2 hypothetical protein HISP_16770 [Haloarcula hispanica N601]
MRHASRRSAEPREPSGLTVDTAERVFRDVASTISGRDITIPDVVVN